jgi:hypothetical protein
MPYSGEFMLRGLAGGTGGMGVASGVAVGGTGVAVAGTDVAVGAARVGVGGTGVSVGGANVCVGGIAVLVAVGGNSVGLAVLTCAMVVKVGRGVRVAAWGAGGTGLLRNSSQANPSAPIPTMATAIHRNVPPAPRGDSGCFVSI